MLHYKTFPLEEYTFYFIYILDCFIGKILLVAQAHLELRFK